MIAANIVAILSDSECESEENMDIIMRCCRDDDGGTIHRLFSSNTRVLRSRGKRVWKKVKYPSYS